MDNENRSGQPGSENWVDDVLSAPDLGQEIGPDEHAIQGANLTDLSDMEVDRIVQETKSSDWQDTAPQPADPEPQLFRDEEYRDAFGEGEELAAVFEDKPVKKDEDAPQDAPVKKRRPRRKKGDGLLGIPHLLATAIWLLIIVAIGVSLGRMIWVSAADVLAFGREDKEVTITITETDDMDSIAQKLKHAGLIKYPELFKLYADLAHAEEKISTGTFTLNTLYDYHALVGSMNAYSVAREEVDVMIPEGYTCAQIFQLLEEKGVCTVAELEEYAANGELDEYWFLEGVVRGDKYCLEGYLFPDTYRFYTDDDPGRVLHKFLDDFDYRFGKSLQEKIAVLNDRIAATLAKRGFDQEYINQHTITIREVVIVASLIEKETANVPESYTISSVIYNRLFDWGGTPAFLNIDAALVYALGGNIDPETGKSKPLTEADKQLDSPYNTYLYTGLIPGPIANPGLSSINAALEPEDTDFYYYALDPSAGAHHFSKTYDEHIRFLNSLED